MDLPLVLLSTLGSDTWLLVPWLSWGTLGSDAWSLVPLLLLRRVLQLWECCECDVQVGDVRAVGAVIGCMYVSFDRMDICIPLFVVCCFCCCCCVLWGIRIVGGSYTCLVLLGIRISSQKWASPLVVQVVPWLPVGTLGIVAGFWYEEEGKNRTCVVVESRREWRECSSRETEA